jgi:hypothetical protein
MEVYGIPLVRIRDAARYVAGGPGRQERRMPCARLSDGKETLDISLCAHGSPPAPHRDPTTLAGRHRWHSVTPHAAIAPLVDVAAKALARHFSCCFTRNARRSTAGAVWRQQIIRGHRRRTEAPPKIRDFWPLRGRLWYEFPISRYNRHRFIAPDDGRRGSPATGGRHGPAGRQDRQDRQDHHRRGRRIPPAGAQHRQEFVLSPACPPCDR